MKLKTTQRETTIGGPYYEVRLIAETPLERAVLGQMLKKLDGHGDAKDRAEIAFIMPNARVEVVK